MCHHGDLHEPHQTAAHGLGPVPERRRCAADPKARLLGWFIAALLAQELLELLDQLITAREL
jgi:hypothetical protein